MAAIGLEHRVLRIAGPDAASFLNNLLTNDLDRLRQSQVLYAGLLTPQGKVFADLFVWRGEDALFVETPSAELLPRLAMYKLRAQATIEDVSDRLFAQFHLEPQSPQPLAAPDPRRPGYGWRRLAPIPAPADPGRLLAHRLAAGVPELSADAGPGEVFALEALFEELNGVAFDKGCFVGQENVSRMKRRATTRKKFCRLAVEDAPGKGTPVLAGEVEVGDIRAAADGRGIGLLRLDRALEAAAQGRALSVGGAPARLDPPEWLILPRAGEGD
ncbi:MAG: folate-binding protein YgfZ [Hyphomonadaceae bacterium]|nr:folate-binding protein YgfZ [Hyphomonadaceae bacterium]